MESASKQWSIAFWIMLFWPPFVHEAGADVRLPQIFGDHMVLQRGRPIVVWGWADPEEKVTVSFADKNSVTTANADRSWRVELAKRSVGRVASRCTMA
jgi:sialate O-acetylesterase